jgi:hypothetical protein
MTDEPKADDAKAQKVDAKSDAKTDATGAKADRAKSAAKTDDATSAKDDAKTNDATGKVDDANAPAKIDVKVESGSTEEADVGPPRKRTLKERLKAQLEEYGKVALITYITLSLLTIAGFSIAIAIGVEPSSATGVLGVIGAGWAAAKATMPIRILIVLAITPPIAALVTRRKRNRPSESSSSD